MIFHALIIARWGAFSALRRDKGCYSKEERTSNLDSIFEMFNSLSQERTFYELGYYQF